MDESVKKQARFLKPLSYGTQLIVMTYMSFEKRNAFYVKCPSIRQMEARLPYRLRNVSVECIMSHYCRIMIDNLHFDTYPFLDKNVSVLAYDRVANSRITVQVNLYTSKVAEKLVQYYLNRPGTHVKIFESRYDVRCMLDCGPILVQNLKFIDCDPVWERYGTWIKTSASVEQLETNQIIRDDTIKNAKSVVIRRNAFHNKHQTIQIYPEILTEWDCRKLKIENRPRDEDIADYCRIIVTRSRKVGSMLQFPIYQIVDTFCIYYTAELEVDGRRSMESGSCITLRIDDSTELNIHGIREDDDDHIEIRVDPKRTAQCLDNGE